MTAQHTPGPWFYTTEGVDAYGLVEGDGTSIMHMQALQNSAGARRMEANMRVIFVAPELLTACKAWLADETDDGEFADRLRLIIAKTGGAA